MERELPPNPKDIAGASKPDLSLIPPVALLHEAMALEEGAYNKPVPYGPYNWRDFPVEARTYVAALLRHAGDYLDGNNYTKDASGAPVHNLGAVRACCAILLDAEERGSLIDNRPKPGASAEVAEHMKREKQAAAPTVAMERFRSSIIPAVDPDEVMRRGVAVAKAWQEPGIAPIWGAREQTTFHFETTPNDTYEDLTEGRLSVDDALRGLGYK